MILGCEKLSLWERLENYDRITFSKPQREETYQVNLEALKLSPCYPAFVITAEVPEIYVHQFWTTIKKIGNSDAYNFKLEKNKFRVNTEVFREILQICPRILNQDFIAPHSEEELVTFIQELVYSYRYFMYQADNREISSARKEHMPYPRFTKVIINHFISKDETISMRNKINLYTIHDNSLLDIKDSEAYKTYYEFATGKVHPQKARKYKKVASPSRKLSLVKEAEPVKKAKRVKRPAKKSTIAPTASVVIKDTPGVFVSKKKAYAKADRSKGVPDEKQCKKSSKDEGTSTILGVLDVPKYQSKSDDESWDMEDDVDISALTMEQYISLIPYDIKPGIVYLKIGDDVKVEINANFMRELRSKLFTGTDDEDTYEHVRMLLEIVDLFHFPGITHDAIMLRGYCHLFITAKKLEEIRNFKQERDETLIHAWERYNDLLYQCLLHNLNCQQSAMQPLTPLMVHITPPDDDYVAPAINSEDDNDDLSDDDDDNANDDSCKGDDDKVDSDNDGSDAHDSERTNSGDDNENLSFTLKDYDKEEHDEEYESDDDNENVFEEEDDDLYKDVDKTDDSKQSSYVSSDFANQFLILEKAPPSDHEVTSLMNINMSYKVPSTQISSPLIETTMVILDSSIIASTAAPLTIAMISPLPKLTTPTPAPTTASTTTLIHALPDFSSLFGFDQRVSTLEMELSEIKQANQYATRTALESYTKEFEKKAQEERMLYIDVVEKSVKDIIKDEFKSLLPQILHKEVSDFATPVIHSTINESLDNFILAKSSSQPKSTYKAAESLIEFELKKILLEKIERSESYKTAPEHKELYEGLVKSYNHHKDLFSSYGKAYSLKRDRTKSQPKSSGKSVQTEELVFETANTEMPQDQRGDMEDQPNVKITPKSDWFKKPNKPLTLDRAWNNGKSINSRPPQKWISNIAKASQPPCMFDELMSTPIDFSAYVMHNLKIDNLTQEILVGPAFNLLKGTCKRFVELEYHFEECYKVVTNQLDWNNPEGHEYPFDLSKPLPLIEVQGCQVVPTDYFFNNDLEYLKGGCSSRKYTTSTTKTKAAKYDNIEGIEDMVMTL
uniref:Uncharacterized protein n=1 Tax=Tanacetum cinerariifolium TaxID=118510 RepID=A0A699GU74_TANCI|nr:hypothetical protein [Tanacetum cinerariifolium]